MAIEGVSATLENVTLMSLEALIDSNPIAFHELNEICNDSNHRLFGNTSEKLDELGLLQGNGKPHKSTCEILKAHTRGEGLSLELFR